MKQYEFKITIYEGNDEFWEGLEGKSGCDIVTAWLKDLVMQEGLDDENCKVELTNYRSES